MTPATEPPEVTAPTRGRAGRRGRGDGAGHVLVIVENVPFAIDTRLSKQVDALLEHGYRVTVVSRRDPSNDAYRSVAGVRVLEFPAPPERTGISGYVVEYGLAFLWAVAISARVVLRDRIDVVQLCQPPDVYFPLAWLFRALGCRVVVDQRDLMPELYSSRYGQPRPQIVTALKWLERVSLASAQQVLCVNQYLRERVVAAGVPSARVTEIRNGPVLGRVTRAAPDPAVKQGRRYLCCWIGKMGRQDRLDLLMACIRYLVRELGRTDCQFAILGDGECFDETRRLAAELALDQWVTFTDWVSEDEVFRFLATADLGLDASLQPEVSPVKAIEYMAFGVPLVAFDLRETRATAQEAAAYGPPGDVQCLARTIDALLDDPGRRSAMGAAGRERVWSSLAWDRQVSSYLDVIDGLRHGRRSVQRQR